MAADMHGVSQGWRAGEAGGGGNGRQRDGQGMTASKALASSREHRSAVCHDFVCAREHKQQSTPHTRKHTRTHAPVAHCTAEESRMPTAMDKPLLTGPAW
jgi:hypothetical protein